MAIQTRSIFLDGHFVKARENLIDSLSPGIIHGKGAFETMRVYNGKIFVLEEHFKRLVRGLKRFRIRSPYSTKQWEKYLYQTIKTNSLKEARIRLAVWRENRRLRIAIVCQDINPSWDRKYTKGIKAGISDIKRKRSRFSNVKSIDYSCFRQAFEEAKKRGYDEAVLLNNCNEVVEGSRTNIFIVKKGILYTPAVQCGCLNGITRQIVIQLARQHGVSCRVTVLTIRDLHSADEVFVTNSLIGISPVTTLSGRLIGQGKAGPLTRKLMNAYKTIVHSACPASR